MSPRIVTLTSDFGHGDGFVAAMKGVILGLTATVTLVDVSHEIPPQDVRHAAFVLATVCRYFPRDAVHLAVVDPGVGTSRRPILVETPHGTYVGPDNGIFSRVLFGFGGRHPHEASSALTSEDGLEKRDTPADCNAYVLDKPAYWLQPISDTFHGRDIFASVVGHYTGGAPARELGSFVAQVMAAPMPDPTSRGNLIYGQVIHVDRFGNLVSNIAIESHVGVSLEVAIGDSRIPGPSRSYASGSGLLAIVGSHGFLEIAMRDGNAAESLGAGVGTPLTVTFLEGSTSEA